MYSKNKVGSQMPAVNAENAKLHCVKYDHAYTNPISSGNL